MARLVVLGTACTAAFLLAACVERERDREPYEYGVEDDTPTAQTLWEGEMADQAFVNAMISAGAKAIELSQLALDTSSNPEVKAFADEIIRDRREANDRLRDVVSQLATSVDASSKVYQDDLKRLTSLAPLAFDRQYMAMMVGDHLQALSALQARADRASTDLIDRWAAHTLPMLHEHLGRAQQLQNELATQQGPRN